MRVGLLIDDHDLFSSYYFRFVLFFTADVNHECIFSSVGLLAASNESRVTIALFANMCQI